MERKLPKNIRQIGNVSDNPKVYVEDYVDTFFNQLCEKAKEKPVGAFLIGETFRTDEQDYIFIHGAVLMEGLETKGNDVVLGDKTWKKACEEGKKYFAGNTIMGWILIAPGMQLKLNTNFMKLHERLFMKKSRMFVMKESLEKEEKFFVFKYNDLMEISGHYIYYEKNASMQDYMIANRKQNCVTPSEAYEDRATKNFRSVINKKETYKKQEKQRYSYALSAFLVLLIVGVGICVLNDVNELQIAREFLATINSEDSELMVDASEDTIYIDTLEADSDFIIEDSEIDELEKLEELEGIEELEEVNVIGDSEELDEADKEEVVMAQGDADGEDENQEVEVQNTEEQNVLVESTSGWEEYTVVEGDTLDGISKMICGTSAMVEEICIINELEDSDIIYVGQVLLLPQ